MDCRREPRTAYRHATATLVLHTDEGQKPCATSTADAVALAVRVGLPIYADEALMATFGVEVPPDLAERAEAADGHITAIPQAFRLALDDPPGGDAP